MPTHLFYPSKHHLLYTFIGPTDQEGHQLSQDFQIGSCVYIAWVKLNSWGGSFCGMTSQEGPNKRCLDIQNDMITWCKVAVSLANNKDIPNLQFQSPTNIPWVQQCHKNFVVTCINISDNTTWSKGIKQAQYFRIVEIWQISQLWRNDCFWQKYSNLCFRISGFMKSLFQLPH